MPDIPSRDEQILTAIINGTEYTKIPQSRIEYLLLQLKELIEGGLGVSDYEDLDNKPSINSVTLIGNKTLSDLGIINPMMLMGRVDTVADLQSVQNPQTGWLYLVGYVSDAQKAEYVYTANNTWELMGYNTIVIDSAMSTTSENPVQNKVITGALATKADLSILTPMSESAYEALTTYSNPLYFIYEDAS